MSSIKESLSGFNSCLNELKGAVCQLVVRRIEQQLEHDVDSWLHRASHVRREHVGLRGTRAVCQGCGSRRARDFSRNGHRKRQLVTGYGVLSVWLPRVVWCGGGSVQLPFSILRPYQRLWDDVLEQIERWAQLGLSLRQMQAEIGEQLQTQLGMRKLNQVVQVVDVPVGIEFSSVPPIVMVDAIGITLLQPTTETFRDQQGRLRLRPHKHKTAVLVALGLWPQSQGWQILDWEVAASEDQAAWERLLLRLEQRGVYRERGLELLIQDGGSGLRAALHLIYPHIPHQGCLFHKLRNLWQAIQIPAGMALGAARQLKNTILHHAVSIYRADSQPQAQQLRDSFCQQWQATQPQLVATLLRDWEDTVAFYRVLARFPHWKTSALRTTSLLERLNRRLRRLFRAAGAYHSVAGLLATIARVLHPLRAICISTEKDTLPTHSRVAYTPTDML